MGGAWREIIEGWVGAKCCSAPIHGTFNWDS